MTTTATFQNKPDFYTSKDKCLNGSKNKEQTNPRYLNFSQSVWTAGDENQFQQYRDATNGDVCIPDISLVGNLFVNQPFREWDKYKDLRADAVINTFRYMFNKFKKGIFVKIVDNKLKVFLPFSKANFTNEWSDHIQVNKAKYGSMKNFIKHISEMSGYHFNPKRVNFETDEWYGNNCLIRFDGEFKHKKFYPSEGESNVGNMKNMLEELCANRTIPDIELFVNRRDFPVLTRDGTEPYNNIWGSSSLPLVSHNYPQYIPILSMSASARYADVTIPTWEDWARIQSLDGKWFPRTCREYNDVFNTPWADKKPTAVFRGGSTGCGVTVDTNPRLKVSYLSATTKPDKDGVPYLDAGISNWNLRARKLQNEMYLRTIDIDKLPFGLAPRLSPQEQSGFKYIINVDGHVTAYRLSLELSMGSVVLLVKSQWKIWYSDLLVPYKHYVPVKTDMSDLITQIKWCRENDEECEQIAKNSLEFFNTNLQKKGAMDYLQKTLVDLKNEMGVYFYNTETPLDLVIYQEYKGLDFSYPETKKNIGDITLIPSMKRSFGLFQGLEWIVRKIIVDGKFEDVAVYRGEIFRNKLGKIRKFDLAGFSFAVKTTTDHQKIREHIHETYIGTQSINELCKHIPNFAYIFGMYRNRNSYNVITEHIHGETFFQYINSKHFNFEEYLFIVMQICLAIQMAQNLCGMVHYDLTPSNIMIQRTRKPETFDYVLAHNKVVRIRTAIIPVIIDYGKSHVIQDGEHHGFINMFKVSTSHDIITLMVTSIDQITNIRYFQKRNFENHLLYYANFLAGNKYRENEFESVKELRGFVGKARKYSALIYDNKYKLKDKVPFDLVNHIMRMKKFYKFKLGMVKEYKGSLMNSGNGRQVFEYILSNTTEERTKTYMNVFVRLKHCTLPQPNNLFFIYFVIQSLEKNLKSVQENMQYFLNREGIPTGKYNKVVEDTLKFLEKVYRPKLDKVEEEDIIYDVSSDFDTLVPSPYTEESFLNPKYILQLKRDLLDTDDLSNYREIIEVILLDQGTYKLKDKDRKHYLKNFANLLRADPLNMKNNSANGKTLRTLSNVVYTKDREILEEKLPKIGENCEVGGNIEIIQAILS